MAIFTAVERLSDTELWLLLQQDNEQAFAVIARRYQDQLYRQIYKRTGDEEDTKDMLQNIYISLWTRRQHLVIESSFAPYLTRAAHYAIVNEYLFRKKRTGLESAMALWDEPVHRPVEDTLIAAELQQEFEKELLKMPGAVQEVFRLSRQEGLSVREIALQLGLNEQTVRNYLSTALQSLRAYLKKDNLAFVLALASACWFSDL
ncbi:RNA polymerase sigma-70 factor (ECF subfamily) [Mucilaginibacter gracilis]|uniref:RNA polymerase sigma-70 factor (ECF subfamily) n=1 Tax=Mucilaginibacter gracilis TaxID=423350 RepID=A0A495J195_9SPHI|nr:sigma-70 family RNA polymerase sigma factor [Mucilaginibacter gracilis]RKR82108.1 RNA polymerase sigma-70 factor (ECF subfamily) [Mucilaginibacter gracilis]